MSQPDGAPTAKARPSGKGGAAGLTQRRRRHLTRLLAIIIAAAITTPLHPLGAHAVTYPTLVGHRGVGDPWTAQLGIPENSIPAIQWAAEHHADVVEGDFSITRDNKFVMMHDETVNRTTNGTGEVRDRDLSYITGRWLEVPVDKDNNGDYDNTTVHPPSGKAWLTAARATGKLVFIELKGSGWTRSEVKDYVDLVDMLGMRDRVITAGSETKLAYFRSYSTGKRSWNVSHRPSLTKVRSVAGSSGYATIRLTEAEANPAYITQLQDGGIRVFLWTLDKADHYARALPIGAYGWMCDNTDDAWTWLQEHGA